MSMSRSLTMILLAATLLFPVGCPTGTGDCPEGSLRDNDGSCVQLGDDDDSGDDDSSNVPPNGTPVVGITPASPTRYDDLQCILYAGVEDGDEDLVFYSFTWQVDGVEAAITTTTVPAEATLPNEEWSCFVTPYDGIDWGQAGSASVTIVNTPPSAPTVTITPDSPGPDDDLVCSVSVDSSDTEGDPITYAYSWQVGGIAAGVLSETVPASSTADGEDWTCTVTPNDGSEDGLPGQASVSIATIVLTCPTETFGGSTYYMCADAMGWDDAFASCAASGIHLASIESQAENDFLEVVADHGFNHWWIGLNDRDSEGTWVWDDGTLVDFTAWDPNHPTTNLAENCGHYDGTNADIGEWAEGPCTWDAYYYVCEDD